MLIYIEQKTKSAFQRCIQLLREHLYMGRSTDDEVRIIIVKKYLLIYEVTEVSINILSIWDGRQDHSKLEDILK